MGKHTYVEGDSFYSWIMSRYIWLHIYLMYYEQNCHIGDFSDDDRYKTIH